VRQQLLADERLGATYEERERMVFEGGLKVYTTFDPRAQQQAIAARDANIELVNGVFAATPDPETGEPRFGSAALVSIQPDNGAIRTMVGGPGFQNYQYNLVMGTRNPGSSFKTFYLAAALEAGRSPEDILDGRGPCTFVRGGGQPNYEVTNFDGSAGQVGTLRQLTMQSSNCGYVRLGYILGQQAGVDMAARLGVRSPMPEAYPSTPLGTADITPLDMASAYATLANDGNYNPPYMIERVDDRDGQTIFAHQPAPESVVSPQTARLVSSVLQDNVRAGTGRSAAIRGGNPVAGKTGTHQNSTDAWFVGYSMDLATAVWVGSLGSQFEIRLDGRGITGGSYPARIFGDFMTAYHEGRPARGFPAPEARPATILTVPPGVDLTPPPAPPPPPPGQPPAGQPPATGQPPVPVIPGLPGGPPVTIIPQNLQQQATAQPDRAEQAAATDVAVPAGAGPPAGQ
jgi:penicillin-binding protein 1A